MACRWRGVKDARYVIADCWTLGLEIGAWGFQATDGPMKTMSLKQRTKGTLACGKTYVKNK